MSSQKTVHVKRVKHPIRTIALKFAILALVVLLGLSFSDRKNYFNPNNINNHTLKKWNTYYDFTEKNDVDLLLVGNSHLYTGINPKNLSTALGCNAFILASPGTEVDDHYYALKEAIKVNKPQLVVIETFGLKKITPKAKSKGLLSDQFKSFAARKNFFQKVVSTPSLFSMNNYGYAWSNTVRNHNFLYTNFDQIKKNINGENNPKTDPDKLYLGRFVRFQTGIEDSTLVKYQNLGAPVDGELYEVNKLQEKYIKNIVDLCESNEIELIFLTLPMYKDHISSYEAWKSKLKASLGDKYGSDKYWLDLQEGKGYEGFTRNSFENTYAANQHMTYKGSLLATYKLVDFIQDQERINLVNRKEDQDWIDMFHKEEGFLENNSPTKDDKETQILYTSDTEIVKEVIVKKEKDFSNIIAKVIPQSDLMHDNLKTKSIRMTLVINYNGVQQSSYLFLPLDVLHSTKTKMNFSKNVKPLEILEVSEIVFAEQ